MALNNKPGVSTETRRMIIEAAEKYDYDFTKLSLKKNKAGGVCAVSYRSHNAILSYSPIFDTMVEGMESVIQKECYKLKVVNFYEKRDNLNHYLEDLRATDCVGILLFGTEMREEVVRPFLNFRSLLSSWMPILKDLTLPMFCQTTDKVHILPLTI